MMGPVRHAGDGDLDELDGLLAQLRRLRALREKKRGTFYRGARAFLHFHADPSGLFADVRFEDDFERVRVTTRDEQRRFVARVRQAVTKQHLER
jgi:hypothetical protein